MIIKKVLSEEEQEDICRDRLAEIFGIVDEKLFKEKFHLSIGGSGQELKRILLQTHERMPVV